MYFCVGASAPGGLAGVVARYDGQLIPINYATKGTQSPKRLLRELTPNQMRRKATFRRRWTAWARTWDNSGFWDFPTSSRSPGAGVRRPTADRVMALASRTRRGLLEGVGVHVRQSALLGIGNWRPTPSRLRHEVTFDTHDVQQDAETMLQPQRPTTTSPEDVELGMLLKWRGSAAPIPNRTQNEPPYPTRTTQPLAHLDPNTAQFNPLNMWRVWDSRSLSKKRTRMSFSPQVGRNDPPVGRCPNSANPSWSWRSGRPTPRPKPKPQLLAMKELQPILDRHLEPSKTLRHNGNPPNPPPPPSKHGCTDTWKRCSTHNIQFGSEKRKMADTLLLHYPFGLRAGDVQQAVGYGKGVAPPPLKKRPKRCGETGRLQFGGPPKAIRTFLKPRPLMTIERWGTEGPCCAGGMPDRKDVSLRLNSNGEHWESSKHTAAAVSASKKRGAEDGGEARKAQRLDPPGSPFRPRSLPQVHAETAQRLSPQLTGYRVLGAPEAKITLPRPGTV